MPPLTIEVPDDLAERLRVRAEQEGQDLNSFAVATLTEQVDRAADRPEAMRPRSEYPSDESYIAEAVRLAPAFGMNTETAAGIAAGISDAQAGRLMSLEESMSNFETAYAARLAAETARKQEGDETAQD